ncbi:hypothetical protein [Beijerinckia sp. L45]|uniref:hypothetical protein n=1 Tax=Beijerinckia sp. L45 TaxID=1641855 RepID=UPI00131D5866|nr:hypothetical protein [Beijerinckia sp. L45]
MTSYGPPFSEDLMYTIAGLFGAGASTAIVARFAGLHLLALMVMPAGFLVGAGIVQAFVGLLRWGRP